VKSYAETNCESVLLFGKEHTEAQKWPFLSNISYLTHMCHHGRGKGSTSAGSINFLVLNSQN